MKKAILTGTLLMAAVTFAIAGTPKGETKDANATTSNVVKSETAGSLYWYEVDYTNPLYPNGYIPAGSPLVAYAEQSSVPEKCEPGSVRDCMRGFSSQQTLATANTGLEQIKTDEQP